MELTIAPFIRDDLDQFRFKVTWECDPLIFLGRHQEFYAKLDEIDMGLVHNGIGYASGAQTFTLYNDQAYSLVLLEYA